MSSYGGYHGIFVFIQTFNNYILVDKYKRIGFLDVERRINWFVEVKTEELGFELLNVIYLFFWLGFTSHQHSIVTAALF
jgi:hypothetical protein